MEKPIQPIQIGHIIEEELKRQEKSITWLAAQIHCVRRNIYNIFKRDSIDTKLLLKISVALGVDFFSCYSREVADNIGNPAGQ